jgi:hypothetical protein
MGTVSNVQDSHWISKSLLRNWEDDTYGKLRYFDFVTGRIGKSNAKTTFVSDQPYPPDVEDWLGKRIETPLGDFLARCKRALAAGSPISDPSHREWAAIGLALFLQAGRTGLAIDPGDTHLVETVRKDEAFFDQMVSALLQDTRLAILLAPNERLCLPSTGLVPLPLIGGVGFLMPLSPVFFATIVPKTVLPGTAEEWLRTPRLASMLSVGLLGDRIVLPPLAEGADPDAIAAMIRRNRERAREFSRLIVEANAVIEINPFEWFPGKVKKT